MPIYTVTYVLRASVKSITFCTLQLVHQVGGFTVSKVGIGIKQDGVRTTEHLGRDVDGACFAAGMVAREGTFQDGFHED
jgi:hypothetical protein